MNQEEKEEPHCELENDFLNDALSLIIECNTFDPAKQMQRIRKYAGMNRKEFSDWLNIPYRTMTDWELGKMCIRDSIQAVGGNVVLYPGDDACEGRTGGRCEAG